MDVTRKTDENTPPLIFSSERFNFSTFVEDVSIDCIDKVSGLFAEFKKKPPTLGEALMSMDYGEKAEELLKMFTDKAKEKLEEIEAPGLSTEDVATIFCYTYEWDAKKFGNDIDSPYRKLNKSLSVDRRNPVLKKTRAFLFLLLQALRKLPRYTPANRTLYRGIDIHIQTEVNPDFPGRKPYAAGNEKTWWTFNSTSEDLEVTRHFVQNNNATLFTLSGETWGYDISAFSNFPNEKEILLEPERMLSINNVKREGAIIAVDAEILGTPLVLRDYIKVKVVKIKERKSQNKEVPQNLRVESITESTVTLLWDAPEIEGEDVLLYQVSARQASNALFNRNPESTYIVRKEAKKEYETKNIMRKEAKKEYETKNIVRDLEEKKDDETKYTVKDLEEGKEYEFRVRCKYKDGWGQEWSEKKIIKVIPFSNIEWKKCPDYVDYSRKYSMDEGNPRIATKINSDGHCTIIGNTYIPLNTVTSWSIKIHGSMYNNGDGIYIGIAPFDINQNDNDNYDKCGLYFYCYDSELYSGSSYGYKWKKYGSRKRNGEYVHTEDSVGVVVDTTKEDLSFVLNGVNLGVAYEGIPLDKPLVPCVILKEQGDSVELDPSEVKENVDSSIPVPTNITAEGTAWDSITFIWDEVVDASFYQVEMDGSISCDITTTNMFTEELLLEAEHSFRVRTVRGSSVSEWSDVAKGTTLTSWWKECPDNVDYTRKYSVDENNPGVASKIDYDDFSGNRCTIIGNTHISLNAVTSWNIKVLKSKDNNGSSIYIGIAPSDINQNNVDYNYNKCGWYFNCYYSSLYSGPPHYYRGKEYGPRKGSGQYVHAGDSVGVLMDTTNGELSFILNNVNIGVAYKRIPLDKPLVPCVILKWRGDSVELYNLKVTSRRRVI